RAETLQHRRRPIGAGAVSPREHRIQSLKEMSQPECGIPDVGALVLEAKNGVPQLAQERRAIDLPLDVVYVQLLHGARDRAERRQVRADGLVVETAETADRKSTR